MRKSQTEGCSINYLIRLFKSIKVMEDQERLRHCPILKKTKYNDRGWLLRQERDVVGKLMKFA